MAQKQTKTSKQEKGSKPVFNARAKTDPQSDFMITIGAVNRPGIAGGLLV